jgi:hypothetical protein
LHVNWDEGADPDPGIKADEWAKGPYHGRDPGKPASGRRGESQTTKKTTKKKRKKKRSSSGEETRTKTILMGPEGKQSVKPGEQ